MASDTTRAIQNAIIKGWGIPTSQTQTGTSACVLADSTQTISGTKTHSGTNTFSGTVVFSSNVQKQRQVLLKRAKVGGTAGAVVAAADDKNSAARVPASQAAATIVVDVDGIPVGASIDAFCLVGQIESGGNTVTVDAAWRRQTVAAADNTDASVASMTQLSVTADTAMSSANTNKTLSENIGANESHYVLITVTTNGATDVDLLGVLVTYTTDNSVEA